MSLFVFLYLALTHSFPLPLNDPENTGGWVPYAPLTDEFDGSALDITKWWDHNPEWQGRQPALFMPSNVVVKNGNLEIWFRKQNVTNEPPGYGNYTSGAVQSKTLITYGMFEVKSQCMNSAGSSAFWFYHNTQQWWTEIDVFEIGAGAPNFTNLDNTNLHVMTHPDGTTCPSDLHQEYKTPYGFAAGYHTFGLEWDPDVIIWYLDGTIIRKENNTCWKQPLTLNLDSEAMFDWFGVPTDASLPSVFYTDYVHAWTSSKTIFN